MTKSTPRCLLPSALLLGAMASSFGGMSFWSLDAHAVVQPPPPPTNRVVLSHSFYAPGNAIVGTLDCLLGCTTDDLVFVASDGTVLTGDFVDVSATLGPDVFAWLPDPELESGSYGVSLGEGSTGATFTIGPNSPLGVFDVTLSENRSTTGDAFTCVQKEGTLADIHFYESVLVRARLTLQIAGASDSQYIYDMIVNGEPVDPFVAPALNRVVEGTPSELCYEVLARPIIPGDDFVLAADCVPVDASTLGVHPETSSNQDYVLARCIVPPVGYDAEWCAVFNDAFNEQSCSSFGFKESCFTARRTCPEGDNPPPGAEEDEEMMGTGGSGTGGGSGDGDGDGDVMGDGDGDSTGDGDGDVMGDGDSTGDGDGDGDGSVRGEGDGDSTGDGDGDVMGDGDSTGDGDGDGDITSSGNGDADSTSPSGTNGSCSVGQVGGATGNLPWLLLGLGGLAWRRRWETQPFAAVNGAGHCPTPSGHSTARQRSLRVHLGSLVLPICRGSQR